MKKPDADVGFLPPAEATPDGVSQNQQHGLKVPGAGASTFSGRSVLQSLLRHLRRSKCRLGAFSRSFTNLPFSFKHVEGTGSDRRCFPMPLPYPEVLQESCAGDTAKDCRKRGLNAAIIVLNFLFLGRPHKASTDMGVGKRLSREQWEVVRRLEHFQRAWIDVSPCGPEEMGRTAAKVESLEETLADLELQAVSLTQKSSKYFASELDLNTSDDREALGDLVGKSKLDKLSTFKPVDPDRLGFVGRPAFDPSPFLDSRTRAVFNQPLTERIRPALYTGLVPRVRVHCSMEKKIKLFELLDASGRLGVHLASEVTPGFGSGLFSVVKDLQRDRLILDSRGANTLEVPILRWVRGLAAGECLTRLTLKPSEKLVCSGNDLRDFYYLFRSTEERSRRNVLTGSIPVALISHLHAVKEIHRSQKRVFCSLATLAMGDTQAVEIAQTCHLGLAAQKGIITADDFICMNLPLPRSSTMSGIIIDDFVSLSKVPIDCDVKENPSEASGLADKLQDEYLAADLIPNLKKGFRDEDASSFWGADIDGYGGVVRGNLRRAVPVAALVLKTVKVGFATVELLQILVGSLISLFLYRRRLLSVLDSIFASLRGRQPRDVIRLANHTKSDLLICVVLLPWACTNLRAAVSGRVTATDASSTKEAAVVSLIPSQIALELTRHTLRKSVWAKLLSPSSEWLRKKGLLAPELELPDPEECYSSNPLWLTLAEGLVYKEQFCRNRNPLLHINIGELRAFLHSEFLHGRKSPSTRELFGLDSQVVIGTVLKGRSSSAAMNKELSRSIPTVLAYDTYVELMYFETAANRSDDPTRNKDIRGPSRPLPGWWSELSRGEVGQFDKWLLDKEIDPYTLSGLPPFSELMGEEGRGFSESPDEELSATATSDRAESSDPLYEIVESEDNGTFGNAAEKEDTATLSTEAMELLKSFRKDQFIFPAGQSWPPRQPGFLDLFSGARGVAKQQTRLSSTWTLTFDILHHEDEDLYSRAVQTKVERLITLHAFLAVGAAPVCASFSSAITPPVRSNLHPYGIPGLNPVMQHKIDLGNASLRWLVKLFEICIPLGIVFWIENPQSSWMFRTPLWKDFLRRHGKVGKWTVDYCRYNKPWRKRTWFFSTTPLSGCSTLCSRDHQHQVLRGRSRSHRKNWTLVAQEYPMGVAKAVALAVCIATKKIRWQGPFDPASCAKVTNSRIGEAGHPGPSRPQREVRLEDINLVEPKTIKLQSSVWNRFLDWLRDEMSPGAIESLFTCPTLLVKVASEFGHYLYASNQSLYIFRHFVVFLQRQYPEVKPWISDCWDTIHKWEIAEPTVHRVPLPGPLFHAMLSVSLQWKWWRFSSLLGICFYGISRPGEALRGLRRDLVLPSDLMLEGPSVAYLKISAPKGRRRGKGRVQHITISEPLFIGFLEKVYANSPLHQSLYGGSPNSFRKRWDKILLALDVKPSLKLTPGGIRGGGALYHFQQGLDLSRIMWKMRLKSISTLESYVQELLADSVMAELPTETRNRIKIAATFAKVVLNFLVHTAS